MGVGGGVLGGVTRGGMEVKKNTQMYKLSLRNESVARQTFCYISFVDHVSETSSLEHRCTFTLRRNSPVAGSNLHAVMYIGFDTAQVSIPPITDDGTAGAGAGVGTAALRTATSRSGSRAESNSSHLFFICESSDAKFSSFFGGTLNNGQWVWSYDLHLRLKYASSVWSMPRGVFLSSFLYWSNNC